VLTDVEILARVQFAFTIAFHYLYPPLSIGLGVALVVMGAFRLATGADVWDRMAHFWTKVFGLTFALGVATGIVMEFEFGTNWATYSRYVGDVFGSALAAEGIFAFFLESGFLAILLFGWDRVSPRMHFLATVLVCLGAHFSAVWIVVANSWMQTPAGFHIVGEGLAARAEITDFWAMVFNPSSMERLSHVIMGAWQAGAWLVVSVSAFWVLRGRHLDVARPALRLGIAFATVAALGSLATGSISAQGVTVNQPVKLAAMEGHWPASAPAGMYLFGFVDEAAQQTHGVQVPGMLSWLAKGSTTAPLAGLDAVPPADRPPVNVVFQCYHAMISLGMVSLGLALVACLAWATGRLERTRPLLWILVFAVVVPQLANQLGWFTAEIGRQPWIVQGLLRTSEGLSRVVQASHVAASLILFGVVYAFLFAVFVFLLDQKIRQGPEDGPAQVPAPKRVGTPFGKTVEGR
jgi:cytochrome d ubiquinol oxidase subunit I